MFREIDPESNNRSSHRDSSSRHHSEGESPVNHLASGPFCNDLYLLTRPHRDFALYDVAVLYMAIYNEL